MTLLLLFRGVSTVTINLTGEDIIFSAVTGDIIFSAVTGDTIEFTSTTDTVTFP
jgi:hypothetical protein